ncbi:UNVERIFIED: hypothetical protein OPA17_102 [Vibrio phage OPA17]|nr:hypothetical protein OTA22_104 [Vibrio phage OTA22]
MAILFDVTLDESSDQAAIEWARGFVFAEVETQDRPLPRHSKKVAIVDGVIVHYDFAADYYFFEECSESDQDTKLCALDPANQENVDRFLEHADRFHVAQKADQIDSTIKTRLVKAGHYEKAVYYWRKLPLGEKINIDRALPGTMDGFPSESQFGGIDK